MNKLFALLISIVCLTPCKSQKRSTQNEVVYKIASNKDSIVLTNGTAPFFFGVQIFRNKKSILEYNDGSLQINSTDGNRNDANWFTEHWNREGNLYIINVFNAPEPGRFLIIEAARGTIVGITEPSTAEIFGDIDFDGKFEIGGLSQYCQGGDPNCHSIDYYRVFEIADGFPTDKTLTDFFKKLLSKK